MKFISNIKFDRNNAILWFFVLPNIPDNTRYFIIKIGKYQKPQHLLPKNLFTLFMIKINFSMFNITNNVIIFLLMFQLFFSLENF